SYASYGKNENINLPQVKREEITSLSNEDCKFYKNEDGTITAEIDLSKQPGNDTDNIISEKDSSGYYKNSSNGFEASFPKKLSGETLRFNYMDTGLTFELLNTPHVNDKEDIAATDDIVDGEESDTSTEDSIVTGEGSQSTTGSVDGEENNSSTTDNVDGEENGLLSSDSVDTKKSNPSATDNAGGEDSSLSTVDGADNQEVSPPTSDSVEVEENNTSTVYGVGGEENSDSTMDGDGAEEDNTLQVDGAEGEEGGASVSGSADDDSAGAEEVNPSPEDGVENEENHSPAADVEDEKNNPSTDDSFDNNSNKSSVDGRVDGDTITYSNIMNATDLKYQVLDNGVKETIVINNSSAPTSFSFKVSTDKLNWLEGKNGLIAFISSETGKRL
ncbi:hypothetical protein, partial [Desulfocucumis palustris]|uniref:hypothetical protein n=1 Tax=Desulfocucumis palustris TaxID=1898651 RepID=UPI0013FE378D